MICFLVDTLVCEVFLPLMGTPKLSGSTDVVEMVGGGNEYAEVSYQHTLSTRPINTPYQHTLSTRPINTPYQHALSTHPLNTPYQHTLSTRPIYTYC